MEYLGKMDTFSLEEDEFSELFITQESNRSVSNVSEEENADKLFLGVEEDDFGTLSVSIVRSKEVPHYSDISEDNKDFEKPNFR